MHCRHCNTELKHVFADLFNCPPSNDLLSPDQLNEPEVFYPLKILICHTCFLVQVDEMRKADTIFNKEYLYYSSYSTSWLNHAKNYVDMMVKRFDLTSRSQVIEIASNDGYLLQYFKALEIPVLGVDPAASAAAVAISKGIPTLIDFFGADFAKKKLVDQNIQADLFVGNNVLAHVPDINGFVEGIKIGLKSTGIATFEFPHLMRLIDDCQFDTIYHEHFSYLSLMVVKKIFESRGLEIFDVEEIPTHGGSLRIFAKHPEDLSKSVSQNVKNLLQTEEDAGMGRLDYYSDFQARIDEIKYNVWGFLIKARSENKKVIGYGAAAKGNSLLNYCGIKGTDLIQFAVDASPAKQNRFLPACHIPVRDMNSITNYKPDYVIILPWNLEKEIREQLKYIGTWGGKFVTLIPELSVY